MHWATKAKSRMASATTACLQTALATKKRREVVTPVTVNSLHAEKRVKKNDLTLA